MSARRLLPAMALLAVAAFTACLLSGHLTSQAVQDPTISLDMDTNGTSYNDSTNMMTVGNIDPTSSGSQNVTHIHQAHLVIKSVEDLVGWQVRLNYIGDRLRPQGQNITPFTDNNTLQNVGFTNLPIDQTTFVHRDATAAAGIPAAPPDNTNTAQTALIGATYNGTEDFAVSPDSPAKAVPDDSSYSAPTGGVLSQLNLQVVGNECNTGPMTMDLDDGSPNPPGSAVVVFNGVGTTTTNLAESALFDGTHSETGGVCASPTNTCCTFSPTPTATATASPTATATPMPQNYTFRNNTTEIATTLYMQFYAPSITGINVQSNPPGCPQPSTSFSGNEGSVDWGVLCVDPGESVSVSVSLSQATPLACAFWLQSGRALQPPASGCGTPSATATLTATPGSPTPGTPTPTATATATPAPTP